VLQPLVTAVFEAHNRGGVFLSRVVPLREEVEWISLKFEEISGYVDEFELLPQGRALSLICKATDVLGFRILSLFNVQERYLPPLVESHHGPGVKLGTEVAMLDVARASPFHTEALVHLVRWMQGGRERDAWLAAHLGWVERSTMGRSYQRYDCTRGRIVQLFRALLRE
jgi:hypothetical protein